MEPHFWALNLSPFGTPFPTEAKSFSEGWRQRQERDRKRESSGIKTQALQAADPGGP